MKSKVVKVNVLDVHRPVNGDLESFWQTLRVAGLFNYVPCRPILKKKKKTVLLTQDYPVPSPNLLPLSVSSQGRTWFYSLECDTQDLCGEDSRITLLLTLRYRTFSSRFVTATDWKCVFTCHEYAMDSWPPSPNNTSLMKSVHVGQLGLFFVCNRMFMKMIQDRYSSSYANLWDFNSKPLISAASDKEGFFCRYLPSVFGFHSPMQMMFSL